MTVKDVRYWVLRNSDRFCGETRGAVGVLPCFLRDPLDPMVLRFGSAEDARAYASARGIAGTPHLIEYTEGGKKE